VGAALGLSVLGADDGTVLGDVLGMTVGLKESCKDGAALGNVERTMVGETLGVSVVVLSGSSGKVSALSPRRCLLHHHHRYLVFPMDHLEKYQRFLQPHPRRYRTFQMDRLVENLPCHRHRHRHCP